MTNIQINGNRFTTATAWEVDLAQFSFGAVDGGPETDNRAVFDPAGPNAGSDNLIGLTINSWTNTLIDIDYDETSHPDFLRSVTLRDVTQTQSVTFDVSPDAPTTGLTYPLLEGICSPAADTVRFVGQRFLTATAGPVGYVIPRLADYAAGALLNGPNMIVDLSNVPANWTLVTHTDTVIELSNPDFTNEEPSGGPGDFVVDGVAFHDPTATTMYYYEPWGAPSPYSAPIDGAGCLPMIANVVPAGPNYIGVSGTDLDQTDRWRVFDNFAFDQVYYDSSGPNAGLNPPGATVTVYGPTSVIIGDTAMAGLTITQVQARVDPGNGVADEWYGSALVEASPNVTLIYDSGTDTLVATSSGSLFPLDLDYIEWSGTRDGSGGPGPLSDADYGPTRFTVVSDTVIEFPNASTNLLAPPAIATADITTMQFGGGGFLYPALYTWTGSAVLP